MFGFYKFLFLLSGSFALNNDTINLAVDFFMYKDIKFVCFLSCESEFSNKEISTALSKQGIRISVHNTNSNIDLKYILRHWTVPVGILMNAFCANASDIMATASNSRLTDENHAWLITFTENKNKNILTDEVDTIIQNLFGKLNLSVDADVIAVKNKATHFQLLDIYNFGKIQGNSLEIQSFGVWSREKGLDIFLEGFKYYFRWNFHNLTLRAVSVILGENPAQFKPSILSERRYIPGVAAMTKTTAQILDIFLNLHNFRFNYTIVDRWIGNPKRNSSSAVTNTLYWREQDISVTCIRIFPQWLKWIDPFFPPTTFLEFYYLIPNDGVGNFENRFLTPLSPSVWWCTLAAAVICCILLFIAAFFEQRPSPGPYAVFSVIAAACQQAYEDGVQMVEETINSQGRRLILLVLGLTSMLVYNYYTSSVVSWLLNAPAPSIANIDSLISSKLELTFEDVGYSRQWLESPGFYYYAGYKWDKEDELRDKKVKYAKRTVPLLQLPVDGIELVRTGKYAYHTDPYTASQIIGRKFNDRELCELGSLQMIPRNPVYIVAQKNSPYKQFFVWSLMRALERGHVQAAQLRVGDGGEAMHCAGRTPRALALGQAAPAFIVLACGVLAAVALLAAELAYSLYLLRCKKSPPPVLIK